MTHSFVTSKTAIAGVKTYRYMVELASNELDFEGVPEDFKILDVVVTEPTELAIALVIGAAGYLKDWGIVQTWIPTDCDCF